MYSRDLYKKLQQLSKSGGLGCAFVAMDSVFPKRCELEPYTISRIDIDIGDQFYKLVIFVGISLYVSLTKISSASTLKRTVS